MNIQDLMKPIEEVEKKCTICRATFKTKIASKNLCSFLCKKEHNRQHSLYYNRLKRMNKTYDPCQVCGFNETIDIHREKGKFYYLCPNHHCLVTRGLKSIEDYKIYPI